MKYFGELKWFKVFEGSQGGYIDIMARQRNGGGEDFMHLSGA